LGRARITCAVRWSPERRPGFPPHGSSQGPSARFFGSCALDLLINRALVYGSLTAILAAVYATGVIGGQNVVGGLTHPRGEREPPPTIVGTTVVIAAPVKAMRRSNEGFDEHGLYSWR